jgi:hypothetical protein
MSWSDLGSQAKSFRLAHTAGSVVGLASLGYLWACAVSRRRDRPLAAAIGFLSIEGIALVVGRGNCPFGPLQRQWGDPVPLFELVLPPRAAKAAVPVLFAASVTGLAAVAARPPLP